jgi:nitrogen fixation protein NifB
VATLGDGLISAHFGHARSFLIYRMSAEGVQFLEERRTDQYCTGPTTCGEAENTLSQALRLLADCEAVLCSQIGYLPWRQLESAGIQPNSEHAMQPIETALQAVYRDWLARGDQAAAARQAAG